MLCPLLFRASPGTVWQGWVWQRAADLPAGLASSRSPALVLRRPDEVAERDRGPISSCALRPSASEHQPWLVNVVHVMFTAGEVLQVNTNARLHLPLYKIFALSSMSSLT